MNYQTAISLVAKYRYILIASVVALVILVIVFKRKSKIDEIRLIDDLKINSEGTTITNNQAIMIVENLIGAMDQYGTDEETIIKNLKGLNKEDLLLVIKKFGVKPYNGAGLASNWIDKYFFSPEKNLIGWLKAELSGNDLKTVQKIFEDNEIPF